MSNILCIADLHLHDYPNRNPSDKFRLNESGLIADNIIKVAKNYGCEYLAIAGDILERGYIRSYVQGTVKDFLDKLSANFKYAYIIYGNHDLDTNSSTQDKYDSPIGVILPRNFVYAHQKQFKLENTTIAFNNFQRTPDLSWVKGQVDYLITHATINYGTGYPAVSSQKLDESKFSVAICGDIHQPGSIRKYVSIGVPRRCKLQDSLDCTGVVLNCQTKEWAHVNLNPDKNLMEIIEVGNPALNNYYDSVNNTFSVYSRRLDPTATDQNQERTVSISNWSNIDNLIEAKIKSEGLESLDKYIWENLKNVDIDQIDFMFKLRSVECWNFRSISHAKLDFEWGDKIRIVGSNGSGKTSLVDAIKYGLCDVRAAKDGATSLKNFVKNGESDCKIEVVLEYKGNTYKITRGTSDYGLSVDGNPLNYGTKSNFEKDVRYRLPFIEVIEILFLGDNRNCFLGSLSDERVIEIFSKFLGTDKIDYAYKEACTLLDERKAMYKSKKSEKDRLESLKASMEATLATYSVPPESEDVIREKQRIGTEARSKHLEWLTQTNNLAMSSARIDVLNGDIAKLTELRKSYRSLEDVSRDIDRCNQELTKSSNMRAEINEYISSVRNISAKLKSLEKERDEINNTLSKAKVGELCEFCGQVLQPTEQLQRTLAVKSQKLESVLSDISNCNVELESIPKISPEDIDRINKDYQRISDEKATFAAEWATIKKIEDDLRIKTSDLSREESLVKSTVIPEKPVMPEDITEDYLSNCNNWISAWKNINRASSNIKSYENSLTILDQQLAGLDNDIKMLLSYSSMMSPTGSVYCDILNNLASQFSDENVSYKIETTTKSGKDHLYIVPQLVKGTSSNPTLIEYSSASKGQKLFLDIHFLRRLIPGIGLLILDEYLKHLDSDYQDICISMLSEINVGCFIIISHSDTLPQFNNKTIDLELDSTTMTTKITLC